MKKTVIKILALSALLAGSMGAMAPAGALANPAFQFAAANPTSGGAGSVCFLPDGGKGVVQGDNRTCCPKPNQDGTQCLYQKYINPAIALISAAVGVAIAIAIIVGGIEYITSAGDPQRAASGKKRIVNALIGLIAYALLFAFLQFIIPGGVLNG